MSVSEKAQAVFKSLDCDNAGYVSLDDFTTQLSDFGHTDEEIENLFQRLDTDHSGTIDETEFVRGYKLYAKSTGENFNEDWRLWNQLDQREEEDRLKLSKLFSVLHALETSITNASSEGANGEEGELSRSADVDVAIEREDHSLVVTSPLQPGIASELRMSFMSGMPLSRKSADVILEEAVRVFKAEPNCGVIPVPTKESPLTIVGDLHGSLADLNAIFDKQGPPSATNRFIFNGDYVDRGTDGVEVIMVLCAYKVEHPESVHLNRGNHEDVLVNQSYGFQKECVCKYDKSLFGKVISVFKNLPLCCIVGGGRQNNEKGIFVVHGGLFSSPDVTIDDINAIKRSKYASVIVQSKHPSREDMIVEDMTWSDPTMDDSLGIYPSERGSGIEFGPDVTLAWLKRIQCNTLVRSHECIEDGCDYTPIRDVEQSKVQFSLYTVFSASNYSDGDNQAAVMNYTSLDAKPKVYRFRSTSKPPNSKLLGKNRLRLADLVFRRHYRLLRAFETADEARSGSLSQSGFVRVLKSVLKLDIKWNVLLPSLLGDLERRDGQPVAYVPFLERLCARVYTARNELPDQQAALSQMYGNFELLKATFDTWDADKNGRVDYTEFEKGVMVINQEIPDEQHQLNPRELFDLVDLDRSGEIDMNEFCEAFRLSQDEIVPLEKHSHGHRRK
eukprot:TRINITY_DN4009_c0_g1_i1.p1 TRINITY_DN4009_c0_g1~~TRINITY_DN4009_c0_g1_i1.p1  ORF type:complete len:672 (-),score=171.04 TRINITY_DN4009_c0_g1_i1:230-2245(-)